MSQTKEMSSIEWTEEGLILLDQTKLPNEIVYDTYKDSNGVFDAIVTMKVRGAPAIGVAAAYGLYLAVHTFEGPLEEMHSQLAKGHAHLASSRPTAVNLFWALDRMMAAATGETVEEVKYQLLQEAIAIHEEDAEINRKIGEHLLTFLSNGDGVLTHCNAGALATSRYGTATSPMYLAKKLGMALKIFVDETRPRLQGSTLTALELSQAGLDVTLITDNMAAMVMSQGKVQAVIVGCDRVAANGDTANKIGTLGVSILARYYNIPFYVAAPSPTIDLNTANGQAIPIEERDSEEVTHTFGKRTAPEGVHVYNPSFDVTPAENITAIVTERGIVLPPFSENLARLLV